MLIYLLQTCVASMPFRLQLSFAACRFCLQAERCEADRFPGGHANDEKGLILTRLCKALICLAVATSFLRPVSYCSSAAASRCSNFRPSALWPSRASATEAKLRSAERKRAWRGRCIRALHKSPFRCQKDRNYRASKSCIVHRTTYIINVSFLC
jgi:hypothetical protein